MTADRGYTRKTKNMVYKDNNYDCSSIKTKVSDYSHVTSSNYGRSTITPSRYGIRSKCKIFKMEPEAFIQPSSDELENLIVNLEDIVKEEEVIFRIQEHIKKRLSTESV